jgi:glycosyltransferase involved in cell wall biosynthesis
MTAEPADTAAVSGPPGSVVRVCVVAPSPDLVGGQARQADLLVRGLRDDPAVDVGFLPHNPKLPGPFARLQRVKYVRTVATTAAYWTLLFARLWRYDVVHVFSASYYSYLLSALPAVIIGRLMGKRVLLNYHSGEAEDHLANWPRTAVPGMRLAHRIVAPSGYLVDVFARYGLAAESIHNVVELDLFPYTERTTVRPVFLTNRHHEQLYNVPGALRAFALIQERRPDARFIVAGDGSMRPQLERLAQELGLRRIEFVGSVSTQQMARLHAEADVCINASDIDNMPVSIIECLSSGLPVVTTDAGGIPYIVRDGETALIAPRNDPAALAERALRLLDEPGLAARLGRNGRDACGAFRWSRVRAQWRDTYLSLAAASGRSPSRRSPAPGAR